MEDFLRLLWSRFTEHNIQQRAFELARLFTEHGSSDTNVQKYHVLYTELLELSRGTASEVGRKKFGYMRSPSLTLQGRLLNAHFMLLDCKRRQAPPSEALRRLCTSLGMDASQILENSSLGELRRQVRSHRTQLWEIQKNCEELRYAWLEQTAQDRSRALGDPDWEKKLTQMKRTAQTAASNRRLDLIVKGRRGVLDRIQVPSGEWYYSPSKRELYHYDHGVFEAYPAVHPPLHATPLQQFFPHHTIKVPAPDVRLATVMRSSSGEFWELIDLDPELGIEWTDITSQAEIERALLRRNERHLRQTELEAGTSTRPPLTDIRQGHGINAHTRAILEGTSLGLDLTPEMAALFSTLRQTPGEAALTPILGEITSEEVQLMFRRAKERTSSDQSTLNYTLWKCLAQDNTIAGILSILFSLPFMYGFANVHWTSMTDFMLEKKPGVRHIHTLRIIGKVAAEFNTCLKYLIGKRAMNNFENSAPSDDQHGFRPHRSSIDAGFLKLLTFECARMQKCTVGSVQHDMTAHFDRMYPAMTSIYGMKYGVSENIMLCINRTIAGLQRRVETALGVSSASYGNRLDSPPLGGLVQGKADVPQWSTQQSDALLKAHTSLTDGLHITSPNLLRSIDRHALSFANDTDSQVSSPPTTPDPVPQVVKLLQQNAQTWSNLVQICGGLIALHKCSWQLLAWELDNGGLRLVNSTTEQLVMDDGHGSFAIIEFLPPDQPNVGLGFRLCPNGSQRHHYEATQDALRAICQTSRGAHLTEAEVRQLLRQRLLPKLVYALHISSFSPTECYRLNTHLRGTFLPLLRLNRHLPKPLLFGPRMYGGLEFPDVYTLQDQVQLEYLIKQLRWDKTVANDLLVTLDSVQLCTGLVRPLLEQVTPAVEYLDSSFILAVRRRLAEMDACLWVERAWTPSLQRMGDRSLMEGFLAIPRVSRAQLRKANIVCIYLRVITIADLCDPTGTYIPSGMLSGEWRAGSDLLWPMQPQPPKSYFATFRRLLRCSFCRNTPIHHHVSDSLNLDTPLGKWLSVPRNTWFPVYRTQDNLFWRQKDDATLFVLEKSQTSGFYHFSHTTNLLPLDSHPIGYQQIGHTLWTQRPYRIQPKPQGLPTPPGHIVSNTLTDPATDVITIGCDGSVYLKHEVAACAWMIAETEGSALTACFLLSNISSVSSYRSELEGIYRSLVHVRQLGLSPREVQQWCDNESAVGDSNKPLSTPSAMTKPDADILMAIHHLRSFMETSCSVSCRHVYGHQDTRRRPVPTPFQPDPLPSHPTTMDEEAQSLQLYESLWEDLSGSSEASSHRAGEDLIPDIPPSSPAPQCDIQTTPGVHYQGSSAHRPLSVTVNIECDRLASETAKLAVEGDYELDMPPAILPPYLGSKAMLRIGSTWITSKVKSHILHARWSAPILRYCMEKYGWSQDVADSVSWQSVRSARNKCTATQLMQTTKIMHGWLPVMHMQAHISGTAQCPSCPYPDETLDHLFHCPHPLLQCKRELILEQLRKKGLKLRVPYPIVSAWCSILTSYFDSTPLPDFDSREIRRAAFSQQVIGLQFFPRGFLSTEWIPAMEALGCEDPHRKLASLTFFLWVEVTDALWRVWNGIVHKSLNLNDMAQEVAVDSRLQWYLGNYRTILSRHDFKLMRRLLSTDLGGLSLRTKRQWLAHLDTARTAFESEQTTLLPGQQKLTTYFPYRGHSL